MNNHIEFSFDKETGDFIGEVYKDDLVRRVKNPTTIRKLIDICYDHGYIFEGETVIDDDSDKINSIIDEFDQFMDDYYKSKKSAKNISIFRKIPKDGKLSKKPPLSHTSKIISGLTALVVLSGMISYGKHQNNKNKDIETSTQVTIDTNEDDVYEEYLADESYALKDNSTNNTNNNNAINTNTNTFHFKYSDRSSQEPITNTRQYEQLFEKYANRYGLDKNLLMALAAQESAGDHYGTLDTGYGIGIMQIEGVVHIGSTESAYNFETGEYDEVYVTEESLRNIETNIQIGAMILRQCLDNNNCNVPLALQTYNFGPGNMSEVLSICSQTEGINEDTLRTDPTNNAWLKYRDYLTIGDPEYVEHVFSYLPSGTNLTIKNQDNENITITLANDYQNTKTR